MSREPMNTDTASPDSATPNQMSPDRLHALCQRSWDEGRDPVDDPAVQEFLVANPEHLDAFAKLRERVAALTDIRHTATPTSRGSRRLVPWLSAAAVLLVAISWFSTNGTEPETQRPTVTPGFLSASYHQETRRNFVGYLVHSEVHESRTSDNGMYAVLRIEDRKPIHR